MGKPVLPWQAGTSLPGVQPQPPRQAEERRHSEQQHFCPHGKRKNSCAAGPPGKRKKGATPSSSTKPVCPHGKRKNSCAACSPCPHGKLKHGCKECSSCSHGKMKYSCAVCKAARLEVKCERGEVPCVPTTGCPHGKSRKSSCAQCNPCPHGKRKDCCKECKAPAPCVDITWEIESVPGSPTNLLSQFVSSTTGADKECVFVPLVFPDDAPDVTSAVTGKDVETYTEEDYGFLDCVTNPYWRRVKAEVVYVEVCIK